MRRLVTIVVSLVVLVGVFCLPALFYSTDGADDGSYEETTISAYQATFDVADNGDLDVVETLTVDFPSYGKHGIFRFWDRTDPNDPGARRTVEDVEVTFDGGDVAFEEYREQGGRYQVAKIGDPDSTVPVGSHTYEISYHIDGVLIEGSGASPTQLYWNLIPSGWRQGITAADLTVNLPAPAQEVLCTVGVGEGTPCTVAGEGTQQLTITAAGLARNTPVTLQTGLDIETPAAGNAVPWSPRWDTVLGGSPVGLGIIAALAALAGLAGLLLARRSYEANPQFPLMYAPPEGIGPAQAAYVYTEKIDREGYVATLLHAAEKGAIDLQKNGDAWTITDKGGSQGWAGLDPVTVSVAHLLGGPGTSFTAAPKDVAAGKRLKTEIAAFEAATKSWASQGHHLVSAGLGGFGGLLVIAAFIAAIANVFANPFNVTMLGLVPGAFFVFGSPLLKTGASTKRTKSGRDLWSRVGGFRRVLATDSSIERFDFSGRQELYTAYIPWAVALGCADEWAAKYRTEMGAEPPTPSYFGPGYAGFYAGSAISSMVSDFDSTVSSAISSYQATQSSSSSGGGGFSGGGGGGGGGGGSW
ncbi:DUF2207 domain-containing protein [Nocardioides sp.]|uniref:DUF2207 domain-containing protein n=1 Tax=Nocardioides sp. TaxID=35761 RepID=UPI00286D1EEF|nr:DUF2207 domain-containing protein [Nocardioides sp.]